MLAMIDDWGMCRSRVVGREDRAQCRKPGLQGENGVALLLTMILMVVLSLLTASLFELLKTSTQITGNHRLDLRTTYVADAGVEDAISQLRDDYANNDPPALPDPYVFSSTCGSGTYTVIVNDSPVNPLIPGLAGEKDIICTGTISGFQRAIQSHVRIIRIGYSNEYAVATTSWELIPPP